MKLFPSFEDLAKVFFLIIIAGALFTVIDLLIVKVFGFGMFINTGYSMCKYEDPALEILPINDGGCSWVPFNVLLINPYVDKGKLEIGDNVCYFGDRNDLICHRIFDKKEENGKIYYYIAGLHPYALKEWVPAEKIYGKVVDKFHRGIGGSMFTILSIVYGNPVELFIYINKGGYLL